ncbi:MAG: type II secretion system minor pseudopilin GspK [Sedimentisphaerales bacterium]|nr:type II secretion system minor pseudopilin GspK [Sedimentisphaerales bacterium]
MRRRTRKHERSGLVLVLVLGMVILMSAVLFGFSRKSRTSLVVADGFRDSEQARNCARAGVSIAVAAVRDANNLYADPRFDRLRRGKEVFSIGDGTCSLTITDESGRLNINTLKDKNGTINRKRIDQFLKLIDLLNRQQPDAERIGYGLAAAIIDWTDRDDEVTQLPFVKVESLGAESSYYDTLDPPCSCRNQPIDVTDELLQIRGVTPQVFQRLRDFLTTTGDGRVNINAAPKLVIECLSEQMDSTLAQMIVQRREFKPFQNVSELRDVPGMTDNIYEAIKDSVAVSSAEPYYRVCASGTVGDHRCRIEAVLRRNTRAGNVDIVLYRESRV